MRGRCGVAVWRTETRPSASTSRSPTSLSSSSFESGVLRSHTHTQREREREKTRHTHASAIAPSRHRGIAPRTCAHGEEKRGGEATGKGAQEGLARGGRGR